MRIAILGPANPPEFEEYLLCDPSEIPNGLGGVPVNELVSALLRAGHYVHLITLSTEVERTWRSEGRQLSISVVPYRKEAKRRALDFFGTERREMTRELRRAEVEVVNGHWTYEFGLVAAKSGLPNVITVHDSPVKVLRHSPDIYRLIRLLMAVRCRFASGSFTAVSPYLSNSWSRTMLVKRDIPVISNIVPKLTSETPRSGPKVVITDIANGSALKNVRTLLSAFAITRADWPDAELRLIGPGLGEQEEMARWATAKGLQQNVLFLGACARTDVARNLSESSVFCHASLEESQGVSLIEAMSLGVPVIGGERSGAVSWTLDYGRAGMLVDVRSAKAIAHGISRTIAREEDTQQRVSAGLELVRTRHAWDNVMSAYVEVYRDRLR